MERSTSANAPLGASIAVPVLARAPTLESEIVNLTDGLGIRLNGKYFLDTEELTIEMYDDAKTGSEASPEYSPGPSPTVLGTVPPDDDGSFALDAPLTIKAHSFCLIVRHVDGVVLATQDHLISLASESSHGASGQLRAAPRRIRRFIESHDGGIRGPRGDPRRPRSHHDGAMAA